MASFGHVRDLLLVCFDDGTIDGEEFVLLYDFYSSGNMFFPYEDYEKFHLEDKDSVECKAEFRFEKNDIPLLAEALGIPDVFKCNKGLCAMA